MSGIISRSEICDILKKWQSGVMTHAQVHDWAGSRVARLLGEDWEIADETAKEVLFRLDMMDLNLVTPDDIPAFLSVLAIPPDQTDKALELLEKHEELSDIEERKLKWEKDPFYAPFCKSE